MSKQCLVLNIGYEPIAIIDWQKAISLLVQDKVELVEEYKDKKIHSASKEWAMPSVVRVLKYVARDRNALKFSRENIYARDRGQCQYCGINVSRQDFEYEHVIPKSKGGKTVWENIVVACTSCNQHKGSKTPAEARMRLLKQPVRPTSLPKQYGVRISWPGMKNMPQEWVAYVRDTMYWKDELENDNGG